MNIFLDCEFTELSKYASLISIALYAEPQNYFYAEINDFDQSRLNPWVFENVITRLEFNHCNEFFENLEEAVKIKGSLTSVTESLNIWLKKFEAIEIWGDVPHFDWVLFCELFGGALHIPPNIHFICRDIATLFWSKGIDINIQRITFADVKVEHGLNQHNALFDAYIMKACYDKLKPLKNAR